MTEDIRTDGTVLFLPHRLNRHPVVVRGLTANELWVCAGLSGLLGLASGVALAILLALASPEDVTVLGITAVAGNVPLALTEKNARIICELAGKPETRVFAGCDRPLARKLVTAEHVHGKTGLDGPQMDDPVMPLQPQHAVDFIIDTLRNHLATRVATAPRTSVAHMQ